MMNRTRTIFSTLGVVVALVATMFIVHSCGIYSFTGTSIQPDVKTVTINYFEYQALKVNPSLSNDLTTALQDKFLKLTKLEQVDMDGDLEIIGEVTGYDVKATAITANEQAAQNRLTVNVKIAFVDRKYPEKSRFPLMRILMRCSSLMLWSHLSARRLWRSFARIYLTEQ